MNNWQNYIELNPEILFGKPVIKGTRIPVELIIEKFANDTSMEELLTAYPTINKNCILACLHYAASTIKNELVLQ